jgi:hypothetical protein
MKMLSHGALSRLSMGFESISKQAARWQLWFEAPPDLGYTHSNKDKS